MTARRFAFLINPGAGDGRAARRLELLLSHRPHLAQGCLAHEVIDVDDSARWIERLPPDAIPVAAGGDGTLNHLVRAARQAGQADRILGLLPLGTGNAVAHSLGLGRVEVAANGLRFGVPRPLDLFATTHPAAPLALASISAGFEALVMSQVSRFESWRRLWGGVTGLALSAFRVSQGVTIELDGRAWLQPGRAFFNAGLYNLRRYAFGRLVFPEAALDDGHAEAMLYESGGEYVAMLSRPIGARRLTWSARPRAPHPFRRARITGAGSIQLDGEARPGGDFEVRLEPGAWRLLVTPESSTDAVSR